MKSTETRLFVYSTAFRKLIKAGPLWGEFSGDRRDFPTKGQWWQLSMKWCHDQCKAIIENSNDLIDTIWLTLLLANRNMMPSLTGSQRDGRCIHQYYVPSTPCFHMNWGEHLLMVYLYWIGNLLVINSNSDHTATSTIFYLGCKSISYQFFLIVLSPLLGRTFYSKI